MKSGNKGLIYELDRTKTLQNKQQGCKNYSRKWDSKKLEADKAKNNDNLAQVAQM